MTVDHCHLTRSHAAVGKVWARIARRSVNGPYRAALILHAVIAWTRHVSGTLQFPERCYEFTCAWICSARSRRTASSQLGSGLCGETSKTLSVPTRTPLLASIG